MRPEQRDALSASTAMPDYILVVNMKVDVERLLEIQEELALINNAALGDIAFYENGEVVDIPQDLIDDWKFVGLSNVCFITTGAYKG